MDPALREALAALRALGDPTRAFGANKARGMQAFAAAARERVSQLHEPEADVLAGPCGEEFAEHSAEFFRRRGIDCRVEKASGGFVVVDEPTVPCATCGEEPATFSGRCQRCNASIQEEREAA